MAYTRTHALAIGAADPPADDAPTLRDVLTSGTAKTVSGVALTYHGYRRTGSIGWALAYGMIGRFLPLVGVPIALAQGFGKKKEGC